MERTPATAQHMQVISGGIEEGRVMFIGLINNHLITTNKSEKNLLINYRKLNRPDKEKCVVDAESILNGSKTIRLKHTNKKIHLS